MLTRYALNRPFCNAANGSDRFQASYDKKQLDVGANLFIGNLDPMVDETMLYNTFSTFGPIASTAKVCVFIQISQSQAHPSLGRARSTNRRIKRIRLCVVQRL